MKRKACSILFAFLLGLALWPSLLPAQGTRADYERAAGLQKKFADLTVGIVEPAAWIGNTHRFWYRRTVKGGGEFVVMDAESLEKKPAFDHQKLAAALSAASGESLTAITLPFTAIFVCRRRKGS